MKRHLISLLAIAGILAACHSINKNSITGTYANHAENQFSIADDTLQISKTASENVFTVTRQTAYRRIVNGKPDSLRHLAKKMTGSWDGQKQQLVILQTGTLFTFPPDGKSLLYGNSEYRKR